MKTKVGGLSRSMIDALNINTTGSHEYPWAITGNGAQVKKFKTFAAALREYRRMIEEYSR